MIAGADEAGRGPIIGSLVVAGVMVEDEQPLIDHHVRDSKKCTPKRRAVLADIIKSIATSYEVVSIPAQDIDDMRKVMTINEIEVHAFVKVLSKLKPMVCYVDAADVNAERFGRDIKKHLPKHCDVISQHKADEVYPVVGAASILAKTIRDQEVRTIERQLQQKLLLPLGSGYPADPITQHFLDTWVKKYGSLPPHTRKSWKTAQNILRKHQTKTLDEF
jgi:ribonuclease HII